jgi:uncharacterized membrane protein YagU involved in acid resistance
MNAVQRGIWSGFLATGPMTLAMFELFDRLPAREKSPLPPATLTKEFTDMAGARGRLNGEQEAALTMLSHFGYGAAAGLLYSATLGRARAGSPVLRGSLFGLGVWAVSYLGWTPVFGFRAAAPRMPFRRNWMMIAAHIVWGASLGFSDYELHKQGFEMLAGHKKAPAAE